MPFIAFGMPGNAAAIVSLDDMAIDCEIACARSAVAFMLSVDGLMSDLPSAQTLHKRIAVLVEHFAR